MGTVPTGTGELRMTHSLVSWMLSPVDRSMAVSAPHMIAHCSFCTSSSIDDATDELPMFAFTCGPHQQYHHHQQRQQHHRKQAQSAPQGQSHNVSATSNGGHSLCAEGYCQHNPTTSPLFTCPLCE